MPTRFDDPSFTAALAERERLTALDQTALLDTPAERAFDRLTKLTARELGVPIVLITLVTEDRQWFKSQCGLPEPLAEERETPLSHSFCQHVVADEAPLIVSDARRDPRLQDNLAIPDLGVIAYAGFPLTTSSGQTLGSFCAIDARPRTWMPHELELLRDMAGATMDIVELRAEAVAAADAAGRLQRVLVPAPPHLDRGRAWATYRPGDKRLLLGGDFLVCTGLEDGGVGVMIGDVVGHGPEAAGFAAAMRAAFEALELTGAPLPELAARLNVVAMTHATMDDRYATALFGRIAPDRRSIEVVSAGHPPLVVLTDHARELALLPGPPLGILTGIDWPSTTVELPAGAQLLLYTDGLTEARGADGDGERLGVDRVLAEIDTLRRGGAEGDALLEGLVALATGGPGGTPDDDIALLLVRPDDQ